MSVAQIAAVILGVAGVVLGIWCLRGYRRAQRWVEETRSQLRSWGVED